MMKDNTITSFEVLLTNNRKLAHSHLALRDAICAMRAGWHDVGRELLTMSNHCLRDGGFDPVIAEPTDV